MRKEGCVLSSERVWVCFGLKRAIDVKGKAMYLIKRAILMKKRGLRMRKEGCVLSPERVSVCSVLKSSQ